MKSIESIKRLLHTERPIAARLYFNLLSQKTKRKIFRKLKVKTLKGIINKLS